MTNEPSGQNIFGLTIGESPLIVSIPHAGTRLPDDIAEHLTPEAIRLPDTDWFLDRLYSWVGPLDATVISATHSRYIVDLNRPPDNRRLYETATTGLFPQIQFDGTPIYRSGKAPDKAELEARLETYYWPYHQEIEKQINRVKELHGYAVLFDAHSIHSEVPRLFEGRLADFNLGTNKNQSCSKDLAGHLSARLQAHDDFSFVMNGRFTGGYITRHYGKPADNMYAVQLELSMRTYMDETKSEYSQAKASKVQPALRDFVQEMLRWKP